MTGALLSEITCINFAPLSSNGTPELRGNNFRFSHSSIKPNGFKYHFQWRFERFEHFPLISIFATVEVLCKLWTDFLIQSFRRVLFCIGAEIIDYIFNELLKAFTRKMLSKQTQLIPCAVEKISIKKSVSCSNTTSM